jgi:hypothetical protein
MACSGDIGQQPLLWVGLDHRHVLQRCGVKDKFWPPPLEDRTDSRLIADVREQRLPCNLRVALGEFEIDQPERVFAVVEQDQALGSECRYLARKLAADRAASPRNDDPPALDQPRHALAVERHLGPVQQVFDSHGAQLKLPGTVWQPGRIE